MKIVVMGPIKTENYFGGVAVFDKELCYGLKEKGIDTILYTSQKDAKLNSSKIRIRIVNFINFRKAIKKDCPDIIIASLSYAKYYLILPRIEAKKIYFLHGFFNVSTYGVIKSIFANLFQKIISKKVDLVLTNSKFTKLINEDIFGLRIDDVLHIGMSKYFINNCHMKEKSKNHVILFSGRLVKSKHVENIIKVIKIMSNKDIDIKFKIAGTGPELKTLIKMVDNNSKIEFLGNLNESELKKQYEEAEIYVSLNPSEPFGIVFLEAISYKCKILCPNFGGQLEFLNKENSVFECVDYDIIESIETGINNLLEKDFISQLPKDFFYKYSYVRVADDLIRLCNSCNNEV